MKYYNGKYTSKPDLVPWSDKVFNNNDYIVFADCAITSSILYNIINYGSPSFDRAKNNYFYRFGITGRNSFSYFNNKNLENNINSSTEKIKDLLHDYFVNCISKNIKTINNKYYNIDFDMVMITSNYAEIHVTGIFFKNNKEVDKETINNLKN